MLCTRLYKYAPNLESLLTQQYACVMCTLWSDNTWVFTRFHSLKNTNTQLIWSSVVITKIFRKVFLFLEKLRNFTLTEITCYIINNKTVKVLILSVNFLHYTNLHLNTKLCMHKLKGQVIWHVTNAIHQIQLIKIYSYFGAEISQ